MSFVEKILLGLLIAPYVAACGGVVLFIIGLALGRDAARYGCAPRSTEEDA